MNTNTKRLALDLRLLKVPLRHRFNASNVWGAVKTPPLSLLALSAAALPATAFAAPHINSGHAVAVLARSQPPRVQKAPKSPLPPLSYTQYRLPNGLRVIFHVDHSAPIVTTNLWYHVGSKNENVGRTGFAHLFEHMMFQGSKRYDDEYFNALSDAGGQVNASTAPDRTNYYNVVPSNYLERALFLEADRMGGLLDVLTQAKFANQRAVVQNEKRQSYDNRPYGRTSELIASALYPKTHPYSWLTIGSMKDLDAASVEDVKAFFRRYYVPNNASLVVAGDFDPAVARGLVAKYFGPIKRGAPVVQPKVAPVVLSAPKKLVMTDRVQLSRLYLTWPTVKQFAPDDAALDVLSDVLTSGKTSRLYQALVYKRQLAQDVQAYQYSRELTGEYGLVITAKPGVSLDEIARVADAEIAKLQKTGATKDEVSRSYASRESSFVFGLQQIGGFGGRADQMNAYATLTGNPDYFAKDLARYAKVTPRDVGRVAAKYLTRNRVELRVTPEAGTPATTAATSPEASATGALPSAAQAPKVDTPSSMTPAQARANLPSPGTDPKLQLPQLQRATLSNGLQIMLVRRATLPLVSMNLVVRSGSEADPKERPGLASFTASLLDEGTKTRSSLQLSDAFDAIGAQFGASASWDGSRASITTLTRYLPRAAELLSDVILHPAFPQAELERQRALLLNGLRARRDDANALADSLYPQLLFGAAHPYGHAENGTEAFAQAVSRTDIEAFYDTYWRPNNSTLIVVGDTTMAQLKPVLQARFGAWKRAEVPPVDVSAPATETSARVYLIDKPGAPQSAITVGAVGLKRTDADFFAARVLNTSLGGQFSSRINLNLREDKGYTYGASSYFDARRGQGPFAVEANVQTDATTPALKEIIRELSDVRSTRPLTAIEAETGRDALIRGFGQGFETAGQVASRLELLTLYNLPDNYFANYTANIRKVTAGDAETAAKSRLNPDALTILIVGDASRISEQLRAGGFSPVTLDTDGNRVGE